MFKVMPPLLFRPDAPWHQQAQAGRLSASPCHLLVVLCVLTLSSMLHQAWSTSSRTMTARRPSTSSPTMTSWALQSTPYQRCSTQGLPLSWRPWASMTSSTRTYAAQLGLGSLPPAHRTAWRGAQRRRPLARQHLLQPLARTLGSTAQPPTVHQRNSHSPSPAAYHSLAKSLHRAQIRAEGTRDPEAQ